MRIIKFFMGLILMGIVSIVMYLYFNEFTDPTTGLLPTTTLATLPWQDWETAGFAFAAVGITVASIVYLIIMLAKGKDGDQGL